MLLSLSMLMMIFKTNFSLIFMIFTSMMLIFMNPSTGNLPNTISFIFCDSISSILMIMTSTIILTSILSIKANPIVSTCLMWLFLFLTMFFVTNSTIMFFISYEMALFPIFFLITYKGYQPERLSASIFMLMYTMLASAPLMIMFLFLFYSYNLLVIDLNSLYSNNTIHILMSFFLSISFLVKTPIYLLHLWLPKAHVEAPFYGSMILAAIMLKMGSFGLIRFINLIEMSYKTIIMSIMIISLINISLICISEIDLKIIIAYSSVSHMAMSTLSLFTFSKMGCTSFIISLIAHAYSSSAMFFMTNTIYTRTNSRNMLLIKNLQSIKMLSILWFFIIMSCMGTPPTLNFFSELFSIMVLVNMNFYYLFILIMSLMMSTLYSVILFNNVTQGKINFNIFYKPLSFKEFFMYLMHILYLYLFIFTLPIFL